MAIRIGFCAEFCGVDSGMDSGVDCKLEAKLARNGLFNKAAALVALVGFDIVDTPEAPTVVEGYDTGLIVEFTGGT